MQDKFENANPDIEIDVYKAMIMEHARDLWNNWHGDLNRQFVKPARNMQQAIKNFPKRIKKPDWEWLVKEHFYSKDFIVSFNLLTYIVTTLLHILYLVTMVSKIISWNCIG
jgi:hypothetical protein